MGYGTLACVDVADVADIADIADLADIADIADAVLDSSLYTYTCRCWLKC